MGLKDLFKQKPAEEFDPLKDLTLDKLKVGYFVDYDMQTWQVTAYNRYDYGDGYFGDEWELVSSDEKRFLERSVDDEVEWTLSKKIPLGMVEGNIRKHIIEHEDPPEEVTCQNEKYYLDDSGPAYFIRGGKGERIGYLYWNFYDEKGEKILTIEQWDEEEFEAALGIYVEEYQFSNILPGGNQGELN